MDLALANKRLIEIHSDPILFAKYYFNWDPWPHQEKILRSKSKRIIMRIGRRGGKSDAILVKSLWLIFTRKNFTIIVMTPSESQIEELWDNIETRFIGISSLYKASVKKLRRSPYRIQLKNGSRINFVTAGTKTGGHGLNVRGRGGDVVVLDEMDRLNEKDIESAYALLAEQRPSGRPVELWCASTPTGKRSYFYKWCTEAEKYGFEHYHVPCSQALPNWTPELEAEYRLVYPGFAYEQECDATFGEEVFGWFPKDKIEAAQQKWGNNYSKVIYPLCGYMQKSLYPAIRTMGVDWDKIQAGPEIVIIERMQDAEGNIFYKVINRTPIPRQKYSLNIAVDKVIELNEKFDPQFIYLDRGYGDKQLEDLNLYAEKHPDSGLLAKLRGVSNSETMTLVDPVTKKTRKERLKPIMANHLRVAFERDQLVLNPNDSVMIDQIHNYTVVRINESGMPVFSEKDEHIVDALMLAFFAMKVDIEKYNKCDHKKVWIKLEHMGSNCSVLPVSPVGRKNELEEKPDPGEVRVTAKTNVPMEWCRRGQLSNRFPRRGFLRKSF